MLNAETNFNCKQNYYKLNKIKKNINISIYTRHPKLNGPTKG